MIKETRFLEVAFTDAEVIEMRKKISINLTESKRKQDALVALKKQMQGEIDLLDAETQLLADKANSGKEIRNVEVKTVPDWNKKYIIVRRLDTNEEIENRPMRPDELQMDLVINE